MFLLSAESIRLIWWVDSKCECLDWSVHHLSEAVGLTATNKKLGVMSDGVNVWMQLTILDSNYDLKL